MLCLSCTVTAATGTAAGAEATAGDDAFRADVSGREEGRQESVRHKEKDRPLNSEFSKYRFFGGLGVELDVVVGDEAVVMQAAMFSF